ncbi:hypothetical protein [Fibrella forsythiae]|uniref:Uncharacterized protein n=1 Tax=Fibrella forsythiae TaxID=2817061 RepID=A0ABS3JLK4_9BACT|nr:hypothetical protein [Fibrella forsythiae]MBO0950883.1 hypothetical protein [Fibrella forsythiae]
MIITSSERASADKLTALFLKHKAHLAYANTGIDNSYSGWVSDFRLSDDAGNRIRLDLRDDQDLFLLFVLAIVWSRTGPWENSAFFVAQLKTLQKHDPLYWSAKSNCDSECAQRHLAAAEAVTRLTGYASRKKVSYRADIYNSIHILASRWPQIRAVLEQSNSTGDFHLFMEYMRGIEGLGVGSKKMLIKIPLILRELRCQGIYQNILGEHCCVPDARVVDAAKELHIKLPIATTYTGLKASSAKIYQLFGDLYDLPLFAYPDLVKAEASTQL